MQTSPLLFQAYTQGKCKLLAVKLTWCNQSDTIHHIYHKQSLPSDHRASDRCSKAYFDLAITAVKPNILSVNKIIRLTLVKDTVCLYITSSSFSTSMSKFLPSIISSKTLSNSSAPESNETCSQGGNSVKTDNYSKWIWEYIWAIFWTFLALSAHCMPLCLTCASFCLKWSPKGMLIADPCNTVFTFQPD